MRSSNRPGVASLLQIPLLAQAKDWEARRQAVQAIGRLPKAQGDSRALEPPAVQIRKASSGSRVAAGEADPREC